MNKFSYIVLTMLIFFSDVYASEKEKAIELKQKFGDLAQDVVLTSYENSSLNDDRYIQYQSSVPNILKLLRTQRKFTANINSDNLTYLEFGPGNEGVNDEIISRRCTNNVG